MALSVNKLPSINVPFVNSNGLLSPIWYEFFRTFIANTVEDIADATAEGVTSLTAGAGLTGGGAGNVTLTVGQGAGVAVNADDVAVDISGQAYAQAAYDDEVMISDVSESGITKKTTLRSVAALSSPGGNNTEIQFNDNGVFEGDSGFVTDGAGSIDITGDLDVDNINLNANTITTNDANGNLIINPNGTGETQFNGNLKMADVGGTNAIYWTSGSPTTYSIGGDGGTPYIRGPDNNHRILTNNNGFSIFFGASRQMDFRDTEPGVRMTGNTSFYRTTNATLTASTTQTQGQGALVKDYNIVTTVANNNDTVTLPGAIVGRHCIVANAGANILQIFPESGDNLGAGLNTSTTLLPGQNALFIAYDTVNWRQLVGLSQFLRTVTSTITASTTQTQGQGALTRDINEVSTVANNNDTVTLPTATIGAYCLVINDGANTLQVFPASSDNLGAGVNTATTIRSGSRKLFIAYDVTNWEEIIDDAPVQGPASSTDNAVARYDSTTGLLVQDSGVIVDDSNNVTGVASLSFGQDALNYYDEGTWTPAFTFDTAGDLSMVYGTQSGHFTRIGRMVIARFLLIATPTHTTAAGNARITGLPFTVNTGITAYGYTADCTTSAWPAGTTQTYLQGVANTTYMNVKSEGTATASALFTITQFATTVEFTISGSLIFFV